MKLTVLIDNNTLIDRYFLGEPGVSYWVQDDSKQILFDVGYSNAFILNAQKMNLHMLKTDFIVLSHGHLDHTRGLDALLKFYAQAKMKSSAIKRPTLISHPAVFNKKSGDGSKEIGCMISESEVNGHFDINLTKEPYWLTDRLVFLGEIERTNDFENKKPCGRVHTKEGYVPDFLLDDSGMAYKATNGLVIITGCSHSGICNIVEQAKKVCGQDEVLDVIGGFHLLQPSQRQLEGTLAYFKNLHPRELHACHCVDLDSKIALAKVAHLKEVGVGMIIEYK